MSAQDPSPSDREPATAPPVGARIGRAGVDEDKQPMGCRVVGLVWLICTLAGWKAIELLFVLLAKVRVVIVPGLAAALLTGCGITPAEVRKALPVPTLAAPRAKVAEVRQAVREAATQAQKTNAALAAAQQLVLQLHAPKPQVDELTKKLLEARDENLGLIRLLGEATGRAISAEEDLAKRDEQLAAVRADYEATVAAFNRAEVKRLAAERRAREYRAAAWLWRGITALVLGLVVALFACKAWLKLTFPVLFSWL